MTPLIRVPCIDQTVRWPTGCESASAVMLLQALGLPMTMEQWVGSFLECRSFSQQNGQLTGPDPRLFFAGDPADPNGMGCWSGALTRFLNKAFSALGAPYKARQADGAAPELLQKSLAAGIPVAYWATIDARPAVPGPSWLLQDTGQDFLWQSNEHCMLLVGMDADHCWFNDPLHADISPVSWPRSLAEQRHREQQSMAVIAEPLPQLP